MAERYAADPCWFFREYINKLYQENLLIKKKLEITFSADNNKPETVDLTEISMPLLNIIGEFDDICTPAAAVPINDVATSDDKSLLRFPTGHPKSNTSDYKVINASTCPTEASCNSSILIRYSFEVLANMTAFV